jgi:ankyrin repeat protein
LQKGADPNAANTDGNTLTALMLAAAGGHAPTVKALIEAGANVNATGAVMAGAARVNQNLTPLMQAVSSGDQETVSLLIQKGADVNARDKTSAIENNGAEKELNRRPVLLHFTNAPVLRTLLEHAADPNAADSNGTTALMIAAERGDTLSVQTLLAQGANANARRRDGMTALSLATRAGKKAIVSMLRKVGAKS